MNSTHFGRSSVTRHFAARRTAIAMCIAFLTAIPIWHAGPSWAQDQAAIDTDSRRYAGPYKIDAWKQLERQEITHWFRLEPDGGFEAGAEWPYHEKTQFSGTWAISGGKLILQGDGEVWTNQGSWRTDFARSYAISEQDGTITLTPVPEKNRYGLLGWPNAFVKLAGDPAGQ